MSDASEKLWRNGYAHGHQDGIDGFWNPEYSARLYGAVLAKKEMDSPPTERPSEGARVYVTRIGDGEKQEVPTMPEDDAHYLKGFLNALFTNDDRGVQYRATVEAVPARLRNSGGDGDLRKALAFAASCIKGGEPWTETCEKIIGRALDPPPEPTEADDE